MKPRRFTVVCDVFNIKLEVFAGVPYETLWNHFNELEFDLEGAGFEKEADPCSEAHYGCLKHKKTGRNIRFLWLEDIPKATLDYVGTISHESLHAAQEILEDRGIDTSNDNTETVAYLQEFIFKQVLAGVGFKFSL